MKVWNRNIFACFMGFAVLSIFNVNQSFAVDKGGLFVEPMVTYEKSSSGNVNFPAPFNSSDTDIKGFGAGLRLGFHIFESVFLGADGRYSMPKFEDTALNQDTDAKSFNYGPVVGLQMPFLVGLRAWGGWVLGGHIDPDASRGVDEKFKSANGWRVGAGIKVAMASLNIEYQDITYDETQLEQVGIFTTGTTSSGVELDNKSWVFSVSFPMAI